MTVQVWEEKRYVTGICGKKDDKSNSRSTVASVTKSVAGARVDFAWGVIFWVEF